MIVVNKIKSAVLFVLIVLIFTSYALSQEKQNESCFEIKYLDFFGLNSIGELRWSDEEINKLLQMDYRKEYRGTRFFIPPIVYQLKDFYPICYKSHDIDRYNKLVSLYFKVTMKDVSQIKNKSIEEQLNFIRADFYDLIKDEKILPLMRYTMDDGPLYGEITKGSLKAKPLETLKTDFGKLAIIKSNEKIYLLATDKENNKIWLRIMRGANLERYLQDLRFDKEPIEKTSLATIIHFYSEGERLNLFLKPDGEFLYYYHSW